MDKIKIINIDSDNRLNSTESITNFTYEIDIKDEDNVDFVALKFISFPKTYYLVNSPYNTFTLSENGTPRTITIPVGNYNIKTFRASLQTLLSTGGLYTYTVQISSLTSKYTITASNTTLPIVLSFSTSSTIYKLLGLNYNSTNTFSSGVLVSDNVVQFTSLAGVYLRSNIVKPDNTGFQNLAIIPVLNYADMSYVTHDVIDVQQLAQRSNIKGNKTFSFALYDFDDNLITLNGGGSINIQLILWEDNKLNHLMELYYSDELIMKHKEIKSNNIDAIQRSVN